MSESVYTVGGGWSGETIAKNLCALLPTRHHGLPRRRFTLLDTFDGRVRRAGARLIRFEEQGNATLAWQPPGGGEVTLQSDQPVDFVWDLPGGQLRRSLTPVIGVRRLLAHAEADCRGTVLDVLDDHRKTVARLRIESAHVRPPRSRRGWQPLPTVITLLSLRGYEDAYARLLRVIESRPGLSSCPEGLQALLLRHAGVPAIEDQLSLKLDLSPTMRADAGARAIHCALLRLLRSNESGVRDNLDTEFLHDFRVALRRTRSLLGQLKGVFPQSAVEHFAGEFSWLGRLTGPPRDLDVLMLEVRERRTSFTATDHEAVSSLLTGVQARERQTLVDALASGRYRALLQDWQTFLDSTDASGADTPAAAAPLADVVARRAWKLSKRLFTSAQTLSALTPAEHVHDIRIVAKKLRYLIDATPSFYGADDVETILGALKKLQKVLGDFNDAHVQSARLQEFAAALAAGGAPDTAAVALNQLAAERSARGREARPAVAAQLARFAARPARSACRRAFARGKTEQSQ